MSFERLKLFLIWGSILAVGLYYFQHDTRKMNKKHHCDIDVFFTDWKDEKSRLLSEQKETSERKDPLADWNKDEIESAEKDLAKRDYIPEEFVKKAEDTIEFQKKMDEFNKQYTQEKLNDLQNCLNYVETNLN